jgi:hypothetical protein
MAASWAVWPGFWVFASSTRSASAARRSSISSPLVGQRRGTRGVTLPGKGDATELIDGWPLRNGGGGPYVFSPDQVRRAADLGIRLGPSWFDVIVEWEDLRAEMQRRLSAATGGS